MTEMPSRCVLLFGAAAWSLWGCSPEVEPCERLELGETVQVTILANDHTGCGAQLDLVESTELLATITDFGGGDNQNCTSGKAKIDVSNGWSWTYASEVNMSGTIVGSYAITDGTCDARASLALIVPRSELRVRIEYGDCGSPCATGFDVGIERN